MLFTCILRSFNWTTVRYIHLSDLAIQACYHLARKLLPALRGQMPFWSSRRFELQAATSLLLLFSISTLRDEASDFTVSRDPNSAHSRVETGLRTHSGVPTCPGSSGTRWLGVALFQFVWHSASALLQHVRPWQVFPS